MDDKGFLAPDRGTHLDKDLMFEGGTQELKVDLRFFCGHKFSNQYDPFVDWNGMVKCQLPKHDKGTTHIGFTPTGQPRQWSDLHGSW